MTGNGKGVRVGGSNVLGTGFQIRFVERVNDGAPRWLKPDYAKHVERIDRLDREATVRQKIRGAHEPLYDRFAVLTTCVEPTCPDRSQALRLDSEWGRDPKADDRLRLQLVRLARGQCDQLADACPACGKKLHALACAPMQKKWVYVLKEEGGNTLTPVCEIELEGPTSGTQYGSYDKPKKQFKRSSKAPFPGYLALSPAQLKETLHFFASPVRLGPKALDLLCHASERQQKAASERGQYDPAGKGVPVQATLQPWATTVARQFGAEQVKTREREYIPLVDPFAWTAAGVDLDYVPILGAQQELIRNADEQAKAFVAAVLNSAIGRRQVGTDPPKWEEDSWDVKDDTVDPPAPYASSGNIAKAWLDRYQEALTYLTTQVHQAAYRVVFGVRFAPGHRIVEAACQEQASEAGTLALGMLHWVHILKDLILSLPGEAFVTWLAKHADAAEHIPARNVLQGADAGEGARVHQDAPGLALQLYALLNPAVIKDSQDPAAGVLEHLAQINVQASSLGGSELKLVKDTAVDIGNWAVDRYLERLPKGLAELGADRVAAKEFGAQSWKARLSVLDSVKTFEDATALLMGIKTYTEEAGAYDTPYDKYGKGKAKVEYPLKVADFLGKQARNAIKGRLSGEAAAVIEKVEKEGTAIVGKLSTSEYEILLANRSVRAYQALGTGARILAGPVGLVLGGADLVAESGKTITEWQGGDPGAAVGHALMAGAALCVIAVAAAETTALVTGAASAAWAGPVGWIAAGLMLLGALILSLCSKNDLEKFAQHCWLGPDYGDGDWDDETGKAWMGNKPWPWLRYAGSGSDAEAADCWQRQKMALLRMISGFKVICCLANYGGGDIWPTYLGGSSALEVEVDVWPMTADSPGRKETYRAIVWPIAREWVWIGTPPGEDSFLRITPDTRGEKVSSMRIQAKPRSFSGDANYQIRVRLCLDGAGQSFGGAREYLPVSKGWVVNNASGYRERDSSSVD